jgi:hypothetical protein
MNNPYAEPPLTPGRPPRPTVLGTCLTWTLILTAAWVEYRGLATPRQRIVGTGCAPLALAVLGSALAGAALILTLTLAIGWPGVTARDPGAGHARHFLLTAAATAKALARRGPLRSVRPPHHPQRGRHHSSTRRHRRPHPRPALTARYGHGRGAIGAITGPLPRRPGAL